MFERIAKFRKLQPPRAVATDRNAAPANDNRPALRPSRQIRNQRARPLICRWVVDRGQLVCRWEIARPREPNPPRLDEPPARRSFTQASSYCRTTGRMRPREARNGAWRRSLRAVAYASLAAGIGAIRRDRLAIASHSQIPSSSGLRGLGWDCRVRH